MASPRAIVSRSAVASERVRSAAANLAERFGIDASVLNVSGLGGPEMKALREREALADFLEALATAQEPQRELVGAGSRKAKDQ